MAEYIDRKAAVRTAVEAATEIFDCHTTLPLLKVANKIRTIPAADVVEVVRCKDCEYLLFDTEYCKPHNRGYCKFDDTIKQPNHFCGYGTRKEGAEE